MTTDLRAHEAWCVFDYLELPTEIGSTEATVQFRACHATGAGSWEEMKQQGYTCRRVRIVEMTDEKPR